jgi:hypothetical protein
MDFRPFDFIARRSAPVSCKRTAISWCLFMFDFLLQSAFTPFTMALALLFGLLAAEVIAALLGSSLLAGDGQSEPGELDLDITDFDLEIDEGVDLDALELAEIEAEAPEASTAGVIMWLGIGVLPVMIWLVVLLAGFGVSGIGFQLILRGLLGSDLPGGLAAIPAGAIGLWVARKFGPTVMRLLPKPQADGTPERVLARRRGVVTQGTASRGRPAEVRVMDRFGKTHYVQAEPLQDSDTLEQGTDVLVLRDRQHDRFVLVGMPGWSDFQSVEP